MSSKDDDIGKGPQQDLRMRPERTFLHDLSSPVSALQLNLDALLEECEEQSALSPELMGLLKDACANAERIILLVRERRQELIAAGAPSEKLSEQSSAKPRK